jgi:hypothetical protein
MKFCRPHLETRGSRKMTSVLRILVWRHRVRDCFLDAGFGVYEAVDR